MQTCQSRRFSCLCRNVKTVKGWVGKRESRHDKRRLLSALFLTNWNFATSNDVVMNMATVDALGMCLYTIPLFSSHLM